jgi:hypothetical protein
LDVEKLNIGDAHDPEPNSICTGGPGSAAGWTSIVALCQPLPPPSSAASLTRFRATPQTPPRPDHRSTTAHARVRAAPSRARDDPLGLVIDGAERAEHPAHTTAQDFGAPRLPSGTRCHDGCDGADTSSRFTCPSAPTSSMRPTPSGRFSANPVRLLTTT